MSPARGRPAPGPGAAAAQRTLGAIVLAAGRSKRFRSAIPKVLHELAGRTLVEHVLDMLRQLHRSVRLGSVVLVVPPGGLVESALSGLRFPFPVSFAVQARALGTGDAARKGLAALPNGVADVLVVAGDSPLLTAATVRELVRRRRKTDAALGILTAVLDDPGAFGRVVRRNGSIARVVEAKDASSDVLDLKEANVSTYVFERRALAEVLPRLRRTNAQGEYYLTDAVGLVVRGGERIADSKAASDEVLGANTRRDFAACARAFRERSLNALMDAGVTVIDPASTFVDAGVVVGTDTVLFPHTILESGTRVGRACEIGPSVRLTATRVGDRAHVSFCVARGSRIGADAVVGPFVHLAPGTVVSRMQRVEPSSNRRGPEDDVGGTV